jgi:predicted ArsR family transcriptional regulator
MRIVDVLRAADGPLDAAELAEQVGLHANTVRSHLRVLAEAGLVAARAEQRTRPGRPRLVFAATPEGTSAPAEPAGYRLLAEILASHLAASGEDSAERAEEAGRAWGRYLVDRRPPHASATSEEDVASIVRLLDEFGFEPRLEPAEHGHTLLMQHCPFGEVADSYRKIVCSVHLGLIQGALDELGARVEADALTPFVKPGVCSAHLERISA